MKRTLRRFLGMLIGLALGWWAAGYLPGAISVEPVQAAQTAHAGEKQEAKQGNAGLQAARELVPSREQVPWLRPVLLAVAGLFGAAILIGVPISRMKTAASTAKAGDDHATAKTDHGHSAAKAGH